MKKCIIIGSGLGGLSCGCILAKNDYDVTVLEQGRQVGGCLQCFRRKGVLFDTGMHYIGSMDKGQTLHAIAHYLGIDTDLQLNRLDTEGYDDISIGGVHYHLANGREKFVDTLAKHFTESRKDLEKYYDLIERVTSTMSIHTLTRGARIEQSVDWQLRSVGSVIGETVNNNLLREVLCGISPLYAGEQWRTPFTTHALISDFYRQSAFRIVGGSEKIAQSLRHSIENMGGRVLTNKKVVKILCDDTKARSVLCDDGDGFDADVVISDIHPTATLGLLESHLFRPAYRHRIEGLKNTTGAFTVYLKFKKGRVPYLNNNLFLYKGGSVWNCQQYDESTWPKFLLYMHFCHKSNPIFAETAEVITYMNFNDVRPWLNTKTGNRGEDYEEFKHRKAELIISALEKECPNVRGNVEAYYTSTPLTYRDYTGSIDGAMYGVAKDVTADMAGRISPRTRVPNLLLTGQSITSHGMLGVLAGSMVTCSQLLSLDAIYDQMKID